MPPIVHVLDVAAGNRSAGPWMGCFTVEARSGV